MPGLRVIKTTAELWGLRLPLPRVLRAVDPQRQAAQAAAAGAHRRVAAVSRRRVGADLAAGAAAAERGLK